MLDNKNDKAEFSNKKKKRRAEEGEGKFPEQISAIFFPFGTKKNEHAVRKRGVMEKIKDKNSRKLK